MAIPAQLEVAVAVTSIEAGQVVTVFDNLVGIFALFKDAALTPHNLVGCAVQSDGSVKKTGTSIAWDGGVVSNEQLTSGDGAAVFVANTEPAAGTYPEFGGRQFFAGLTTKDTVSTYTDIEFGLQVFQAGVVVWESGVQRRNARAPRNNGVYSVGVENGQVVYRADGDIIYRSGIPITYPLRFGAAFVNPGDHIGGTPANDPVWTAYNSSGAVAGTWGGNTWSAPNIRGRYKIRALTSNNAVGYGVIDVLKRFPWGAASGLPCPTRWFQQPPQWSAKETVFDDGGSEVNLPYEEPIRTWRIEYSQKLDQAQAAVMDAFFAEHRGPAYPFYFYDDREEVLYDNVRFVKDRYTRDHSKIWAQSRTIELIRRPY